MTNTFKSKFWVKPVALSALAALSLLVVVGCDKTTDPEPTDLRTELIAEGQTLYGSSCNACHGAHGEGESGPPLKHSDYLIAQRMRPVRILLMGLPNPIDTNLIVVNGITHENQMFAIATASGWTNRQIAAVLTYVRAVMNDSTSTNCIVGENGDGQPVSDCDIIASPADATTMITPDEVGALRDSLRTAGLID
jgi:mono/diheme cytochrome c family protein